MKTQKIKCYFCGDNIKGKAHDIRLLYNENKTVRVDEGCFLLAKEKGLIKSEKNNLWNQF